MKFFSKKSHHGDENPKTPSPTSKRTLLLLAKFSRKPSEEPASKGTRPLAHSPSLQDLGLPFSRAGFSMELEGPVWGTRSIGRPRCLGELKTVQFRPVRSDDSLKGDAAHGETPAHQTVYRRDNSSRLLNMMWEAEEDGGEMSRSALFETLINIENWDAGVSECRSRG